MFATMDDDLAPPPPQPRSRGNSREYLYARLERGGFHELLRAVDAGTLSVYAAASAAGFVRRPEPLGTGSPNARKKIDWTIHQAYRGSERADVAQESKPEPEPVQKAPNDRTTVSNMPDLVAALEEVAAEMRQKTRDLDHREVAETGREEADQLEAAREELPREQREPAPAVLLAEPLSFPIHPAVPCTACSRPEAPAALREVVASYVAGRRGEPQNGNVLPSTCCKRQVRGHLDAKALIA
jgi:hypothetical protein